MSALDLVRQASEAVENTKNAAKAAIEAMGNRILELLGNDDTDEIEALANEMINDSADLSSFIVANTPAENEPEVPTDEG